MSLTSGKRITRWLAAGLMLAAASVSADQTAKNTAGRTPLPQINITKGEQCVEPTDVMRKEHMEFILHQRDETMHKGIRTTKHSLKKCINCHADPQTQSVLGEEGFCSSCHAYAAVSMDCFSCHTDKAEKSASRALQQPMDHSIERMVQMTPAMDTTNTIKSLHTGGTQ